MTDKTLNGRVEHKFAAEPVLQVKELDVAFNTSRGQAKILEGVNFELFPKEILALVGETGSRKSVTAKSIMNLIPRHSRKTEGRVLFDSNELLTLSAKELQVIRGKRISMVFQNPQSSINPDFKKLAETLPGPISDFCSDVAKKHNIYFIPGYIYEKKQGKIYNSSPVFDDQGNIIEIYHKMYPCRPHEKTTSGDKTLVFDMPGVGKIGLCNCYDLWFPEVIRDLVFKGAEIIFIPTAAGTQNRDQEIILARAAAIQNQCYVVSVNGLGVNGVSSGGKGKSLIVDPEGHIVQKAGQLQENLIAMVDLATVQRTRDYGIAGVSRPLASFFHEKHKFEYQSQSFEQSPIYNQNQLEKMK
ncbi:MAG: ATP-binding cassette domain-containing protein [Deltaproteobacteria bacterium]|uniref:nitrilase-related carbon-nitrogen hydrolase n=1 Tax=Desulfobacula sp. TaxID=2593537 RepID=UPI0019B7979F|nr:ATP-binding cassette domain-containing protein [Candidatus Desulfobacula maris]MBL6995115.1 ATP-binding cassette domain-containing protein [Desulfobacula sp.]